MRRRMSGLRWVLASYCAITVAATLAELHRESPLDDVGLTVAGILVVVALVVGPFVGPAYLLGERLGITVGMIVALAGLVWLFRWGVEGLFDGLAGVLTRLGMAWQRGQVTTLPYVPYTGWTDDPRTHFHEGGGYHAHEHAGWHYHAPPTHYIDQRSLHIHLDEEGRRGRDDPVLTVGARTRWRRGCWDGWDGAAGACARPRAMPCCRHARHGEPSADRQGPGHRPLPMVRRPLPGGDVLAYGGVSLSALSGVSAIDGGQCNRLRCLQARPDQPATLERAALPQHGAASLRYRTRRSTRPGDAKERPLDAELAPA